MPLAFGALREGDIRLCTEGKVTRISLSSDLYWSMSESILVSVQTYIGQHTNLYWSVSESILVSVQTYIGLHANLYWSMIGPVLVTRRTSIGQRAKQYWLLLVTSTGQIIDQYWSHHPLLRVRCEAYVYEGIVRDALRG